MQIKRKARVANPNNAPARKRKPAAPKHRRRNATKKPAAKRRTNTTRSKAAMPQTRKNRTRKNPKAKARRRKNRQPNPFPAAKAHRTRSNPRRNPRRNPSRPKASRRKRNPEGMPSTAVALLKETGIVMLSLVATRQIPQMILAEKNTGWLGYFANAATAGIAGFAASKTISPRAGYLAMLGGAAYLLNRVLTEKVSPIGQYLALSGVGDHAAITSLGDIQDTYFPYPAVFDSNGQPVIPSQIIDAARVSQPAGQMVALAGAGNPYLSTPYGR